MYKTCQNEHNSCLCYHTCSHVRAPVLSLDTKDVCDQMTMASPDQQAEHAAQEAKTWQLSVETRGSRLVHVLRTMRAPVCLWSVVTHRWIGTGAVRTLWKSQSSVTDKAIMALLCAFKAIIKCDWGCPDATPTERWWGVYRQQIMIGEADGGNTHRIIAFSFQQRKKKIWQPAPKLHQTNYATVCRRNLATFCDTWRILTSECLHSPGEGKNVSMLKIWCRLQAGPTAIDARVTCSTYQTKYPFLFKPLLLPFNLSSWNTCPLGEL